MGRQNDCSQLSKSLYKYVISFLSFVLNILYIYKRETKNKHIKKNNSIPPSSRLYAYLPPRLLFIIVADTPGVGEQRAGERRQLVSLGTLTWTQDAGAAHPLSVYRAVAVEDHMGTSRRGVL